MKTALPCGPDHLELTLPDDGSVQVIGTRFGAALDDPEQAVADSLLHPLAGPPLADLAQGRGSACVVVSDITRPVPNKVILPPLLRCLAQAGVPRAKTIILVATGMHRACTPEELCYMLGREIAETFPVVNHDCQDRDTLAPVPGLEGLTLEVNQIYAQAELKILTGLIEPHPFAGFSGGAKSILPGVSSFETMKFMHSFAMIDHPGTAIARLESNPFQDYVRRAGHAAGMDFLVNMIMDKAKKPIAVFSGEPLAAHEAGCAEAAKGAVAVREDPFDLVVTTGGGYPLDATLYQSSKGLVAVKELTRTGGDIIWVTGCQEGVGGAEFQEMACMEGGPQAFREKYSCPENFVIDQWGAQVFFQLLERAGRIMLYSPNLSREQVGPLGLDKIDDLQGTIDSYLARGARVCVSPEGPYLVGLVKG